MSGADPYDVVLDHLDVPQRNGDSTAMARCPAHEDRNPSLSVTRGDDKVLLHCHAGCSVESILTAAGLSTSDLFVPKPTPSGERRIVATYDYIDEQGELLFQVVRFDPKDFRQRRPNGRGGWEWKVKGTRIVLYRLPAVIAAVKAGEIVYVVEGEKDVEALESAVADDYHIPGRTLSQWRYLGRGPRYMKVGRLVRYRRSDVETWLDANTVTPGMPPDAT